MFAYRTGQSSHPRTAALKAGTRLRLLATAMAAVTVALLASVVTIPAAFARVIPPPGGSYGTTSVAPARRPLSTRPRAWRGGRSP